MQHAQSHILVVDDISANRLVIKRMLETCGHAVTTADDGESALALLRSEAFDLVLLDIMMPGKDGFEVLDVLRDDLDWHRMPVVVVSAVNDIESVVRCIALGASDYLFKPVNQSLLKARVDSCLARKWALDRERAAAQALEDLRHAEGEFVALVSHELRNPITAIRGYAHLLLTQLPGTLDEHQQECLQAISSLAQMMNELVGDLAELTRLGSRQLELRPAAISLATAVGLAVQAVQSQVAAKQQRLTITVPPGLPQLWADLVRVVQILTNLLGNASKYTPEGGSITLSARQADERALEIAVSDTGIGISSGEQPRIFERFFRSGDPRARTQPGSGLGLHITRLLVEAQGGQIWFESAPGVGSTFFLTLPLITSVPEHASHQRALCSVGCPHP